MNSNKEQIIALIYSSVDELNALMGHKQSLGKSLQTVILKDGVGLDSLGFVNFVSLVEQKCEEQFGKSLVLTQAENKVGAKDAFESIGTLVEYVEALLKA